MKQLLILALAVFLSVNGVFGEEVTLSLEDALALAEKNDLSLASARLDVETGDATVREATSAALPKINLSTTAMRHMVVPTMYLPPSMLPPGSPNRIEVTPPSDITSQATFQQPVWLAGKVGMALKAARTYRQIARDALEMNQARLKSDVIREYYGLALVLEVVQITSNAIDIARQHGETVKRMYDVGMASEFDYLRAQVEVKSLEPQLITAQKNADLARIAFCNRLGFPSDTKLILTDELNPQHLSVSILEYPEACRAAFGIRPEFAISDKREQLDKISIKAEQRSIYWPNFVFAAAYQRQAQERKFPDMMDVYWSETFTWTLNMSIPLFDGFATSANIQKAKIGLRRTKIERMQLEQGIKLEVSMALNELKHADEQVKSLETALKLAERAHSIAETRYEQGIGTELEIQDAQLSLHQSKLGYLQGLYDQRIARAEYARIVENDTDLSRINQ
ncbi:TolC family protein [bacterium]|nr:TolC family protein [bacterium]